VSGDGGSGAVWGENTEIKGTLERRSPASEIAIGRDCLIEGYLVTERDGSRLRVGDNVYVGGGTVIDCLTSIEIENDVLISYQCILSDSDAHSHRYSLRKRDLSDWKRGTRDWTDVKTAPIRIGKGAWIGARVIILKGVAVGEGAIVGAGATVTKDVPAWTVVAGNPAKVLRHIPKEQR
jgi:acetyltransferase-like isoleucine patch superfamily enzyme